MRRAIAISLLTVFSWMLIAPFFAPGAEASLPLCCRRHGKHHCIMQMMQGAGGVQGGPARVSEKCPCQPRCGGAVATRLSKPEAQRSVPAEAVRPAALPALTDTPRPQAFLRSHPKRGPPAPLA